MSKKLEDYEWMCPKPFVGIFTESTGEILPCCELHKSSHVLGDLKTVEKNSFKDFYHSQPMVRLRNAMKNNNDKDYVNEVCKNCISRENHNLDSGRTISIKKYFNVHKHKKEELEKIIETETPTFIQSPLLMSLGQGQCNLKCGMCGDTVSSARRRESIELGEINSSFPLTRISNCDSFKKDIDWMLDNCLEFELPEGEPLMLNISYDILKKLNKNVHIEVSTNGTIDVNKFIEHTKEFDKVDVFVSIEGGEKVNSYIRYPSDWDTIIKNFDKLFSCSNFNVKFISTLNALNVGKFTELKSDIGDRPWTEGNLIWYNYPWMLSSIPDDVKEIYLDDLNRFGNTKIFNLVKEAVYNEKHMLELMRHCKRRDKLRGTYLLDVFPEWKNYYNVS
jgi:MoaA/NifB/PqqE/SkfB family radical SAM enzyme